MKDLYECTLNLTEACHGRTEYEPEVVRVSRPQSADSWTSKGYYWRSEWESVCRPCAVALAARLANQAPRVN